MVSTFACSYYFRQTENALLLAGLFYVRIMRRMGLMTIASFFTTRFNRQAGLLATITQIRITCFPAPDFPNPRGRISTNIPDHR